MDQKDRRPGTSFSPSSTPHPTFCDQYVIDIQARLSYAYLPKKQVLIYSKPKIRIFLIVNYCIILYSSLREKDLRHVHPFAKGDTNDEKW
jgi:hypothetical protein